MDGLLNEFTPNPNFDLNNYGLDLAEKLDFNSGVNSFVVSLKFRFYPRSNRPTRDYQMGVKFFANGFVFEVFTLSLL